MYTGFVFEEVSVNVTLSADEDLIRRARARARARASTLNAEFRAWLEQYVSAEAAGAAFDAIHAQTEYVRVGQRFDRDQLNER